MNFSLSNEHRKYMGIQPVQPNFDLVKIKKGIFEEFYLFFDGNNIVKVIYYFTSDEYLEMTEKDVNYETCENRAIVLPKTSRGKERKLTGSVVESLNGEGNYFSIYKNLKQKYGHAIIGNHTTQKTFLEDNYIENCFTLEDMKKWCDRYADECTEKDLSQIQKFSKEKRIHVNYKEGDYFRVKLGKNKYTYGRILLDIYKGIKNQSLTYWDMLMGRALIIEIFHILTEREDVSINDLKKLKTFPAQHIMDNKLYYGDYEIIGNDKIPDHIAYPIMYGKTTSKNGSDIIVFQCGKTHIEIPYEKKRFHGSFINNAIGFYIDEDEKLIEQCLKEKANKPYWEKYQNWNGIDLRHPSNRNLLIKILKEFKLNNLIELYMD